MLSNFHDILVITNEYRGTGFIICLYAAALIYLFIVEKRKQNRYLVLYMPLSLLLLIYNPVFYHVYVVYLDDSGTYYRIFWLLPMTVTIGYAAVRAMEKQKIVGIIIACVAIILCGGYAYSAKDGSSVNNAENAYHIPDYVIEVCDYIVEDIPGVDVYACVPTEMTFYVRQYNAKINLIYGRESIEPKWGYVNEFYDAFERAEAIDLEKLLDLTRNNGAKVCTYFVIRNDRELIGDPESFGLEKIAEVDNYIIYKDTVAVEIIREMFVGTSYEQ